MAKNKKFKQVYKITIQGTTTNNYKVVLLNNIMKGIVDGLKWNDPKLNIELVVEDGDPDPNLC